MFHLFMAHMCMCVEYIPTYCMFLCIYVFHNFFYTSTQKPNNSSAEATPAEAAQPHHQSNKKKSEKHSQVFLHIHTYINEYTHLYK
jgi:hypothetical protein